MIRKRTYDTIFGVIISQPDKERCGSRCRRLVARRGYTLIYTVRCHPHKWTSREPGKAECQYSAASRKARGTNAQLEPQPTTLRLIACKACACDLLCAVYNKQEHRHERNSFKLARIPPRYCLAVCCVARELPPHLPTPTPATLSAEDTTHTRRRSSTQESGFCLIPRCLLSPVAIFLVSYF